MIINYDNYCRRVVAATLQNFSNVIRSLSRILSENKNRALIKHHVEVLQKLKWFFFSHDIFFFITSHRVLLHAFVMTVCEIERRYF